MLLPPPNLGARQRGRAGVARQLEALTATPPRLQTKRGKRRVSVKKTRRDTGIRRNTRKQPTSVRTICLRVQNVSETHADSAASSF